MADNSAKISLGKGYGGGLQVTLYADTHAELTALVNSLFGEVAGQSLLNAVLHDFALQAGPEVAALDAVNRGLGPITAAPAAPAAAPVSTVGQPLPQPGQQVAGVVVPPQPAAPAVAANPPGLAYPGNCAHGARTYVAGKGRGGSAWNRWECALPWQKGRDEQAKAYNAQRCEAINV